jgi:hypothetical protein
MKRKPLNSALMWSLRSLLLLLLLFTAGPSMTEARDSAQPAATTSESWRMGVTSEGTAAYSAIIGRNVSEVAAFRSNRATDIYYMFPAPSTQRTVQSATRFCILSRTGTYVGAATLTLEILDYAGTVQHTVSAAGIDMETAPTGVWTAVTLSGTPADLEIAPGEFLAFHFRLGGASGGDLDVRPIFEVGVE